MPTMNAAMPAWSSAYSYRVDPSVLRTEDGFSVQRKQSHRRVIRASVTRMLQGAELAYFEYFVRVICNEGTLKFTDTFALYGSASTGLIRIVDGAYNVESDTRRHIVSCDIEIFE